MKFNQVPYIIHYLGRKLNGYAKFYLYFIWSTAFLIR